MTGPREQLTPEYALAKAQQTENVFLQLTPARAATDPQGLGGELAGMPFAVKDVFDVRGTRTSAASQIFDRRPLARRDAEAVRRITAAGAVLIGKTTMSELAYSGLGVNERFGTPTLTRAGREYLVGGSSSGSAAAVRAGVVAFALASDTSGSGRIPAAWAGVPGFRPSLGRYPSAGMTPLAPTLDAVAVIAASVAHLETIDRILASEAHAVTDSSTPVFVVPHDEYLARCDQDVLERFHADLACLRGKGHRIVQRRIDVLDTVQRLHRQHIPIVESEAFAAFGAYLEQPNLLSAPVQRRLRRSRARLREHGSTALYDAIPTLRQQFGRELGNAVMLNPAAEIDAPAYVDIRDSPELHDEMNARALNLTMMLSYLDAPSAVVPTGDGFAVRPSSLQLSGHSGQDRRVLVAAQLLTSARLSPQ
ncbi:amidase family protein [Nocardia sp. NBC_01329]|uniref:amidase family protein n=1 Tax=Nocardia sp. NBC_01329 TaxID=2903594 RepID=UPI002E1293CC|nr:amidase family protein [Nocardia sp. NBC_01329]